MVVCIVPGMGTVLEGADRLEAELPDHHFLPPNKTSETHSASRSGILAELNAMNALHIGLFDTLQDMGVDITQVVGLSASEPCGLSLVGAVDRGNLERATEICAGLYHRLQNTGHMLLVFDVPKCEVLQAITSVGGTAALGAWFGAAAGAIAGNTSDIEKARHYAEQHDWKHMVPREGYGDCVPFHCPKLFAPFRDSVLQQFEDSVAFSKPRLPYFSSYTGGRVEDDTINGDFLFSSMAGSAHSFDAICACIRAGHRQFVELNLKPLYVRTVEEAFVAEKVTDGEVCCCGPSKVDMEQVAAKLTRHH